MESVDTSKVKASLIPNHPILKTNGGISEIWFTLLLQGKTQDHTPFTQVLREIETNFNKALKLCHF